MKLRKATRGSVANFSGRLVVLGRNVWTPAFGHAGLVHQLHQFHAAQRRRAGRLHDHRATGRDRRRDLVNDQVERMVEGRDRRDDADRLLDGECPAAVACGREAHRDLDPGAGSQKVRCRADAVDRPIGLDQCIRERLSALARDQDAEILPLRRNQIGELVEDGDPLMRLQPGLSVREQFSRGLELRLQRGGVVTGELGDLLFGRRPVRL